MCCFLPRFPPLCRQQKIKESRRILQIKAAICNWDWWNHLQNWRALRYPVELGVCFRIREIISQSEWFREKQTVTRFIFLPQTFLCLLSHTQIVQLIKGNSAVDFLVEAFAGFEIWELDCLSPWSKKCKQHSVFMGTLNAGMQSPSNCYFWCSLHQCKRRPYKSLLLLMIQGSQIHR